MEDLQAADHKLGVTAGIVIFLKAVNDPSWSTVVEQVPKILP